jgi:adenosylcobinamide-GDP ribazoletransferase
MKPFFAAIQFLTLFPVPASWSGSERELGRSVPYFPVVGLLIGALVAVFALGLEHVLPGLPVSVIVVFALIAASGALHLDGLADTADAFLSSRPKERMLEIMRDSRVGPMGVAAIVAVVLLKVSLVSSVTGPLQWRMLVLMPLAGRCSLVLVMALLPYARPEGGLATVFQTNRKAYDPVFALIVLLVGGWFIGRWMGLAAGIASIGGCLLFATHVYHKIGGSTGDTHGATCELVEIIPALVAVVWVHLGA